MARTFRLPDTELVPWLLLLPNKNCLIVYVDNGTTKQLVRIDLNSGEQKIVQLAATTGIDTKPLWDKASEKLIIVVNGGFVPSPDPLFDSLAHLDPDDLTIKDVVAVGDIGIQGLLFADASGQHVTAFGFIGGAPFHDAASGGTPGFLDFDMATGKSTTIMKDTSRGDFWYLHTGIAAIDHRFVIMAKQPTPPIDFGGYRTYCVDLQEKNAVQLLGIKPFVYPTGHDGLLLASPPANAPPSATPARP